MRYDPDHKPATRQRILASAGRRLKEDGIDRSGISALMADAGLTNGAFYSHFSSKQDLVATAIAQELDDQAEAFRAHGSTPEALEFFIREYLTQWHVDHRGDGCPSAALLDEIGRCNESTRKTYSEALMGFIDEMAIALSPGSATVERSKALSIYAVLVGTMQLSRALTDPELAARVLDRGVENAMNALRSL
ncbi:TetR/AcrR family transcriptional regulator [Aeromicrobium ginsengisoli]|uniref:TetR/AcrR family transcriptional regulator n=1 Tax=Aeromicrobium ginsengisoli TaxID=363867 RepID=UPI001CB74F5A|nr:TetR/AcrR family transcriptional regulator [Aeromicrobium ginsengisoli]